MSASDARLSESISKTKNVRIYKNKIPPMISSSIPLVNAVLSSTI